MENITNILEYSSQMSSLGKCCEGVKLEPRHSKRLIPRVKHVLLHQGAVEGCCIGFTKFCVTLLSSSDAEIRDIPADMLNEVSDETQWRGFSFNKLKCWTAGLQLEVCLSTGIKSCAVASFYIRDPTGCRIANAHPVCLFSRGEQ